jgi:hypothetical protein
MSCKQNRFGQGDPCQRFTVHQLFPESLTGAGYAILSAIGKLSARSSGIFQNHRHERPVVPRQGAGAWIRIEKRLHPKQESNAIPGILRKHQSPLPGVILKGRL